MSQFSVPLQAERLRAALENSYWRVNVVGSTGSTQIDLVNQVRNNEAAHGSVLVTDYQSAGRGRLDRTFTAPTGSALLFSFYIEPKSEPMGWVPLLAGQAVREALWHLDANVVSTLKWPNDVLIGRKKVAGLLAERIQTRNRTGVIIGIGINVTMAKEDLPTPQATSLFLEGFSQCDRNLILPAILQSFGRYLERWEQSDLSLLDDYANHCSTIGQLVEVELPDGVKLRSRAVDVDPTGALVLADGFHVTVGDVVHLNVG